MAQLDSMNDGLDDNLRDKLVAIGKGVANLIPFAGGLIGEVVGLAIPTQRADRIAQYLRELTLRVENLATEIKDRILLDEEMIDLIEEGGFQAARATSSERIHQIVEAVGRGLSEDDSFVVRKKRLLLIFGELDNDEINLLNAFGRSYAGMDRNAFDRVNRPDPPHMQSQQSELDANRLYEAGESHLVRLGLLRKNYGNIRRGETPEFNAQSGDFKHNLEISDLGRMLLKIIGLQTPFDEKQSELQ